MEHRMERKRIQFGLNTESFVDLNTGKFKSVKQWRKKMRSLGETTETKDCFLFIKEPVAKIC